MCVERSRVHSSNLQMSTVESESETMLECDSSSPNTVEVSTQLVKELVDEESTYSENDDDENIPLSELICSYLTAADDLVGELRKDETLHQTVVPGTLESDKPVVGEGDYLDSLSIDEKKTAVSYEELLRSYQTIFQKWQASGI